MAKHHIQRRALPWPSIRYTYCGISPGPFTKLIESRAFADVTTAPMFNNAGVNPKEICSVCVTHWKPEEYESRSLSPQNPWNPAFAAGEEIARRARKKGDPVNYELKAISDLVFRYRGEFEALVAANITEAIIDRDRSQP
jgi:hypothetical protein